MSHHILGFAEKLFNTDPRPSALSIEKVIGNFVLLDILFQVILIGYILIDDFVCNEVGTDIPEALESTLPPKPAVDEYLGQVCGTQIRDDARWFFIEKVVFLFFFLAVFYINKSFISRINRYHVIIMREQIHKYITLAPVYKNVNYRSRWTFTMVVFFLYKIATVIILILLIVFALVILNEIEEVRLLLSFEGVPCGPKMDFVENIGVELNCHLEHEYLIRVISYITNILAFFILIFYCLSIIGLVFYAKKFRNQKSREDELDIHLIGYKIDKID